MEEIPILISRTKTELQLILFLRDAELFLEKVFFHC